MARRDPMVSKAAPDPGPVAGVDNLPLPIGISRSGLKQADESSLAVPDSMSPNDGDQNPGAESGELADCGDMRYRPAAKGSDPSPSMPGA